jgi:hypothetical protein
VFLAREVTRGAETRLLSKRAWYGSSRSESRDLQESVAQPRHMLTPETLPHERAPTTQERNSRRRCLTSPMRPTHWIALQKAAAFGLATLGSDGKVPTVQLPANIVNTVLSVNGQTRGVSLKAAGLGAWQHRQTSRTSRVPQPPARKSWSCDRNRRPGLRPDPYGAGGPTTRTGS